MSLGSCGIIGCTRVRPRGRWVYSDAPWGSLGSSRDVVFSLVRPGCSFVNPRLLGSLV